jgi:hypothetical protein
MATSNSTNVNAREALIEFARQRMTMAYHGVLIAAKHLFLDFACWNFPPNRSSALQGNIKLRHRLTCEIKIRATHEIMAAWATQLALFVDQLMTALRTISPVFPGKHFVGRCWANFT